MVPTAGTVVTEMNTPTSGPDLEVVSASTPATPASSAIRNDQMSGWTMKSVCGPVAASAAEARPSACASVHSGVATRIAIRKPPNSVVSARGRIAGRGRASPTQIAATGENSGPTTIAPMIRIGWSSSRPAPAISVARVRNDANAQDSTLSVRTLFSTMSQTMPSSGMPGAARSAASVASERIVSGSESMIEPAWCRPSERSEATTGFAPSRATSAITRVPAGLV